MPCALPILLARIVLVICAPVHSTAPLTRCDDERTRHAKLYTPPHFHLLRGVRPGVPPPHVRVRGPAVDRHRTDSASVPVNPTTAFAANFRVIAMDQRNAGGQSHAPLTAQDGWHTYLADHIALFDHLGIEQCHLYGQCIGGSFIMSLLQAQPQRIACAVVAQPIGRVGAMLPGRAATAHFDAWAKTLAGPSRGH